MISQDGGPFLFFNFWSISGLPGRGVREEGRKQGEERKREKKGEEARKRRAEKEEQTFQEKEEPLSNKKIFDWEMFVGF